jgi:hypothetical protein
LFEPQDEVKGRYGFLVYAVSVHHWWGCRPLLKDGSRKLAVPSLSKIVEVLDGSSEPDVRWRSRNWLALAQCYDEAGTADKAAVAIAKALDLAKQSAGPDAAALLEETRRMNVHIARKDPTKALLTAKEEAKALLRSRFGL